MSNAGILTGYRFERDYAMFERAVQLCRGRELAIDVGAHKGMWTSWMAAHFDRVAAIEPHPDHVPDLTDRCNKLTDSLECQIEILPCAAGRGRFRGRLVSHGDNDGQWHVEADKRGPVDGHNLDKLATTYGWYRPQLVKIDAEGMELEILDGAALLLETYQPVLVVELEPTLLAHYGTCVEDVAQLLCDVHGYAHVHTSHRDALFVPGA